MFHDDDDFMDDYFEYKLFEDSLKKAERKRKLQQGKRTSPPPLRSTKRAEAGCGTWLMIIIIAFLILYFYLFGALC